VENIFSSIKKELSYRRINILIILSYLLINVLALTAKSITPSVDN
jgi:hypothetical protein